MWNISIPGDRFFIGDIEVSAFSIPHDAADPVGFTFQNDCENDCTKVAIVTDLGYMPELSETPFARRGLFDTGDRITIWKC